MDKFNLLEEFGITKEDLKEAKKKNTKKVAASAKKTTKKRDDQQYALPIKLCGGHFSHVFCDAGHEKWSLGDLKKCISERFPELTDIYYGVSSLDVTGAETESEEAREEGGVKTYLRLELTYSEVAADKELAFPLAVVAGETKMEVEEVTALPDLAERWCGLYPEFTGCKFMYNEKQKVLLPFMEANAAAGAVYTHPITVGYMDQVETYVETDFNGAAMDEEAIRRLYAKKYPEFGDCGFHYNEELGQLVPILNSTGHEKEPESVSLPVELKAGGFKLIVGPDDLGGKKAATLEELREVLEEIYPEYAKGRTEMVYDKRHFVVPILKSSKKGIQILPDSSEWGHELYEDAHKNMWRVETTPFGVFRANTSMKEDVRFELRTPKIPRDIFDGILSAFKRKPTYEYAVQVFWDRGKGYSLYEPVQKTSQAAVTLKRNHALESSSTLVMDIHSHGSMPAFFSAVDDRDEVGVRLYMVVGNLDRDKQSFQMRAGLAGIFGRLNLEDIFNV